MARSVAVLGAGIVGVSCALHLHRRGFEVTLVDRREPGSETSYGNSGVIGRASIAPLSQPRDLEEATPPTRPIGTGRCGSARATRPGSSGGSCAFSPTAGPARSTRTPGT